MRWLRELLCELLGHKWLPSLDTRIHKVMGGAEMRGTYKLGFHICTRCGWTRRMASAPVNGHHEYTARDQRDKEEYERRRWLAGKRD